MPLSRLIACSLLCVGSVLRAQETPTPPSSTPLPAGARYVERQIRMPVPGGGIGLDTLEVYISAPGKHPLVLLTHGTSDKVEDRMQLSPWMQLNQAMWFARRGYVALVVIRKGYGTSGGQQDGLHGGCRSNGGSFQESGEASADDLRAAVEYAAKNLPEVDTATVISTGVSTGGFAQVALASHPPAGLKAAIDFAGGRGGDGKGDLCDENALVDTYRTFGKKARTPMLWIYAENDKWFPPPFAKKFQAAFESKGGIDEFVMMPPDGEDGHHLYSHVAAWSPVVEKYLAAHDLLPVTPPYPAPEPPKVDPPAGLSVRGQAAFKAFLVMGPFKAFATNGAGPFGISSGQLNQQLADQHAVENCNKARGSGAPCSVVARK